MTPEIIQTIVICLAVVTVVFLTLKAFLRVSTKVVDAPKEIVQAGGEAVRKNIQAIGTEIRNLLGATPEITVNRSVIQQAPENVCELYFFKQATETREQLISKKWGSSKCLVVSQKFIIKAGFDLNRLQLHFDEEHGTAEARISDALLISVENDGPFQVEKSENGLWNRITEEERDQLINSLPNKARAELETTAFRQLAASGLKEVLIRICDRRNVRLTITCDDENSTSIRDTQSLADLPSFALDELKLLGGKDNGQLPG